MSALRRILKMLRPHSAWVVAAALAMAGVAIATVFMVFLIGPIFDTVLGAQLPIPGLAAASGAAAGAHGRVAVEQLGFAKDLKAWFEGAKESLRRFLPSDAIAILLLGFLSVLAKNVFTYFGHYAIYHAGLATIKDLRDRLMDRLLAQSAVYYQKQPSAVLMSRITNDVERITEVISDRLSDLVQDSFTVVGMVALVLSLNFRLAVAVLVGAPIFLWPIATFARKLRHRSHQSQERLGEMNSVVDEVLKGYRVVQAFGMEAFEAARFRESTRRHFRANLKARKVLALNAPVIEVIGAAGIMGLLLYAHRLISSGTMSTGAFASFLLGLYSLYTPIKRLTKVNMALQGAVAAGERVFAVIDEPVEVKDRPGARALAGVSQGITFERVSFAYEPDKPVLRSLDLVVPAGRALALVGASGAGKSTVAQLLPRFWDVQNGRIAIDGTDIRDLTLVSLRGSIGLVTQETVLFNTTVAANIAYGQSTVDPERLRACARRGVRRGVHSRVSRRLRHGDRRGRHPPLGGAAAADRGGAGALQGPADPRPRRGHLGARRRSRGDRAARHREPDEGPHRAHHRPPPRHRAQRRHDRGDGGGARRRAGVARRAVGQGRGVCAPGQHAGHHRIGAAGGRRRRRTSGCVALGGSDAHVASGYAPLLPPRAPCHRPNGGGAAARPKLWRPAYR